MSSDIPHYRLPGNYGKPAPAMTPALERAERALTETWHGTLGRPFHPTRAKEARSTVDAALDVEEMARVLAGFDSIPWARMKKYQKDVYREMAAALRAAILGGEA